MIEANPQSAIRDPQTGGVVLELRDVVKTFPGVRALDKARFELRRGEVHALVGENGAGKSTLMNIVAGVFQPDEGAMLLDGRAVRFANPHQAARHGIGVVFQELSLVPNLTVAENIFANRQPVSTADLIDWRRLYADTEQLLQLFELDVRPTALLKNLSVAQQQVVEILKALSLRPAVVILDEPTSSLTAIETRLLFENIRRLKQGGTAFIYISHHLQEIFQIADRVTVMRDGQYVDTCDVSAVTEDVLVRKMVGRELQNVYGRRESPVGEVCFRAENAGRGEDFAGVSFALREGEILGLAGLVGAGRTELGRAIFGVEPLDRGALYLRGERVRVRSPREAIRHRIGYQTEDRKLQGLFLRMTIRDNCAAPSLPRFAGQAGLIDEAALSAFADASRGKFNIVCTGIRQQAATLSGGNQQKVLLAMWVGIEPHVLIVDEPTRGVDVGARSEIYRLLRELAATGVGIIMISSDLQEILGLSDRILVMRNGRLVAEFVNEQATEEKIIAAATGVVL
ncbi:MAG: sugar ABC transporter ATP-binding protein [Planctomycetota bacterium]|nr:sugar ABC transporter ATP-binding protein [Planctomycetota bacterium]